MKNALVTGGSRGLGLELVKTLEANGWLVQGTARDPSSVPQLDGVIWHSLDLNSTDSVAALGRKLVAKNEKIDLLVHNAGFNPKDKKDDPDYFSSTFSIKSFSAANTAESMWTNALMPMELTSRLLPVLGDKAVILGISSWLGSIGGKTNPGHYGYAGSKALLNMFLRGLALEFGQNGRSAVAMNPGWMKTDMGGGNATVMPAEVAQCVIDMFNSGALHSANGGFINTDGSTHPW